MPTAVQNQLNTPEIDTPEIDTSQATPATSPPIIDGVKVVGENGGYCHIDFKSEVNISTAAEQIAKLQSGVTGLKVKKLHETNQTTLGAEAVIGNEQVELSLVGNENDTSFYLAVNSDSKREAKAFTALTKALENHRKRLLAEISTESAL